MIPEVQTPQSPKTQSPNTQSPGRLRGSALRQNSPTSVGSPAFAHTRKIDPSFLPSNVDAPKSVTVSNAMPHTPIALAM